MSGIVQQSPLRPAAATGIAGVRFRSAASEAQKSQERMFQAGLQADEAAAGQARADSSPTRRPALAASAGLQATSRRNGCDGQQRALAGLMAPRRRQRQSPA